MGFSSDNPLQANQLPISIEFPPIKKEFDDILSLTYKRVADAVNKKEGSLYSLQEQANFQQFYTLNKPLVFRNGFRSVFDISVSGLSFAHGIVGITQITNYWAIVNFVDGFRKAPYADPDRVDNQISMFVSTTNVSINIGTNLPARSGGGVIVLEYLKN